MPIERPEEETGLPRATVDKLIQELCPAGHTVAKEARNALRDAAELFLGLIALEANRICDAEQKKTITNQHVFRALERYGFAEYINACGAAASDYDDYSRHRPSRQNKFKESGKSLEELHADQMRLFNDARREVSRAYGIDEESAGESKD